MGPVLEVRTAESQRSTLLVEMDLVSGVPVALMTLDQVLAPYKEWGISLAVTEHCGGYLVLSEIRIPKAEQGQGIGSRFMWDLCTYADETGQAIFLTPTRDFGASSIERLRKFYARFDFKRNHGRHKDFRSMEAMVRIPKERPTAPLAPTMESSVGTPDSFQNRMPRPKKTSQASQFRGVIKGRCETWRISIEVEGKSFKQSGFKNEVEAAKAYDLLAQSLLGPWAVLNFPPPHRNPPPGIGRSSERPGLRTLEGHCLLVDQEDQPLLSRHDWIMIHGKPFTKLHGALVPLVALVLDTTSHMGHRAEHINGNSLDFRKENLHWVREPVLRRQQAARVSGIYRGVRKAPSGRQFIAEIKRGGKTKFLGSYPSAEEAAQAYDHEAMEIYGPEAKLNFPVTALGGLCTII